MYMAQTALQERPIDQQENGDSIETVVLIETEKEQQPSVWKKIVKQLLSKTSASTFFLKRGRAYIGESELTPSDIALFTKHPLFYKIDPTPYCSLGSIGYQPRR